MKSACGRAIWYAKAQFEIRSDHVGRRFLPPGCFGHLETVRVKKYIVRRERHIGGARSAISRMANGEAEHYRRLARDLRERAARVKYLEIADSMLKIADEYEKLARYVSVWSVYSSN